MTNALLKARRGSHEYMNGKHTTPSPTSRIEFHHTSPEILFRSCPQLPRLSLMSIQRSVVSSCTLKPLSILQGFQSKRRLLPDRHVLETHSQTTLVLAMPCLPAVLLLCAEWH